MDASERKYEVWFWVNESGEKPVAKWLKGLEATDKRYMTDLLNDLAYDGPRSRPKVFKHIDEKLWEIRDLRTVRAIVFTLGLMANRSVLLSTQETRARRIATSSWPNND